MPARGQAIGDALEVELGPADHRMMDDPHEARAFRTVQRPARDWRWTR